MKFFNFKREVDLTDYTLIIPCVSVANVPQLTIDLLISSGPFEKLATVYHPAIIAAIGTDPFVQNGTELCTACELYGIEALKVIVLQIRSTFNPTLVTKFLADIKAELLTHKIKQIIILSSSFDYELQVIGQKFYSIGNHDLEKVGVKRKEVEFNGRYLIHGGGIAVELYQTLIDTFDCFILLKYVSEGDNRTDAVSTIEKLAEILPKLRAPKQTFTYPTSWNGVFGGPPPPGIF